jgi:hypothetical protein
MHAAHRRRSTRGTLLAWGLNAKLTLLLTRRKGSAGLPAVHCIPLSFARHPLFRITELIALADPVRSPDNATGYVRAPTSRLHFSRLRYALSGLHNSSCSSPALEG